MLTNLLVPLDGSAISEQALAMACTIAKHTSAAIHLVHVHTLNDSVYVDGLAVVDEHLHSLARSHEREYLRRMKTRLTDEGYTVHTSNPDVHQSVAQTLAAYARQTGCNLVVMTTHGRGGVERMWLGSVADALIRVAHLPILLLPGENTGTLSIKHVVMPLDGSPLAETAITPAQELGRLFGADFCLIQVVEPLVVPWQGPYVAAVDLDPDGTLVHQQEAQAYLHRVAERFEHQGYHATVECIQATTVADAIAQRGNAPDTLIALATHGRHGWQRMILGSIADKIVRSASGPVLLVGKHPRESTSAPE